MKKLSIRKEEKEKFSFSSHKTNNDYKILKEVKTLNSDRDLSVEEI